MPDAQKFLETVKAGYTFKGEAFKIGNAVLDGNVVSGADILLPLKTLNRHGLIAGATGTGKTKTLQTITESLSEAGVPVLLMDIKGDLSGISKPGTENPKIKDRHQLIGKEWAAEQFPSELMSISGDKGLRLRATVSEFGPVLFSKILELNDNQQGAVAIVFKYCDDKKIKFYN